MVLFRRLGNTIFIIFLYLCAMNERVVFRGRSLARFNDCFKSDDDCYKYISCLKWDEEEFVCKKCGNTHYCKGHLPYSRRCTRCKYDESPTAGTMFEKLKFSVHTAFHIVFDLCRLGDGASSSMLSKKYGIRQKTIWEFKRKIQLALNGQQNRLLTGAVVLKSFCITKQDDTPERKVICVAVEALGNGEIGKAYGQLMDCASEDCILLFLEQHISVDAKVYVSEESIYSLLVTNFDIEIAEDNSLLTVCDKHLAELRSWLYGKHRRLSVEHIQGYLDEYYYRFNRRNNRAALFDGIIGLMARNSPLKHSKSKQKGIPDSVPVS